MKYLRNLRNVWTFPDVEDIDILPITDVTYVDVEVKRRNRFVVKDSK